MKIIATTEAVDGIGAEMARQLAPVHGSELSLVLASRNKTLLYEVAAQCAVHGTRTLVAKTDVSAEACAWLILQGMRRREREVAMTTRGRLGRWLKWTAPGKVEVMALAALNDGVKPH